MRDLDIRQICELFHFGARLGWRFIADNGENWRVRTLCEVEERRPAVHAVEGSSYEANRRMPRSWRTGDGQLCCQAITREPTRIAINVLSGHLGHHETADVDPVEQRTENRDAARRTHAGEPWPSAPYHSR